MSSEFRRGDPQRRRYWQGVVRRWKESGRSVREYCRAEGLRESAFFFWRRKLGYRNGSAGTASKRRSRPSRLVPAAQPAELLSSPRRGTSPFLPVRVAVPASGCHDQSAEAGHALANGAVEIVLSLGRTVRVRAGFDRQTLAEVLTVLEARPC